VGLSEFLTKHRLNPEQFAIIVDVHATTIYRLLSGATIPKRENLKKILKMTFGEVTVKELVSPAIETPIKVKVIKEPYIPPQYPANYKGKIPLWRDIEKQLSENRDAD
jgi:hypothetical protein